MGWDINCMAVKKLKEKCSECGHGGLCLVIVTVTKGTLVNPDARSTSCTLKVNLSSYK